jgi:membrane protein CcdC involved in cytochrome C biogenesis
VIVSTTIGFVSELKWIFLVYSIISASLLAGNFSLLPPFISSIYGLRYIIFYFSRNSAEILGVVVYSCGLSCFVCPCVTYYIIDYEEKNQFSIIFWIGTVMMVIAFFVLFFISDKKFDYKVKKVEINIINDMDFQ